MGRLEAGGIYMLPLPRGRLPGARSRALPSLPARHATGKRTINAAPDPLHLHTLFICPFITFILYSHVLIERFQQSSGIPMFVPGAPCRPYWPPTRPRRFIGTTVPVFPNQTRRRHSSSTPRVYRRLHGPRQAKTSLRDAAKLCFSMDMYRVGLPHTSETLTTSPLRCPCQRRSPRHQARAPRRPKPTPRRAEPPPTPRQAPLVCPVV